jgi:hypothetical protein
MSLLKWNSVSLFFVTVSMAIGSVFVQRLTFLGNPDLGPFRMLSVFFLVSCLCLLVSQNKIRIVFKRVSSLIWCFLACLWLGYTVIIGLLVGDGIFMNSFYWLYSPLVLWGYYIISRHTDVFNRYLTFLMFIAGIVGIIMFIAGPEAIQSIGIGAYKEEAWGQFSTIDERKDMIIELLFRSFSIFTDHQAFSGFLQLSSCYFRFCYQQNPCKRFILLSFCAFLFNLFTFSTTGILVLSVILLSYLRISVIAIIAFLIINGLSFFMLSYSELFFTFFHLDSLEWRIEFIWRALSEISWFPYGSQDKMIASFSRTYNSTSTFFTSDNMLLWISCKYGLLFGVLNIFLFVIFVIKSLKIKKYRSALLVFAFVYFVNNILTNGIITSSAINNILFPVILGIILSQSFQKSSKETI